MSPFELAFVAGGMVLYVAVLAVMLRSGFRQYPFIFLYVVLNLFGTVIQASFKYYFGAASKEFARAYWVCDFLGTLLILLIIIHLIRLAMEKHRYRNTVYCGLLLGVALTAGVSVLLMRNYSSTLIFRKLMTEVGRDYYFSAVMLNTVLWMVLVRSGRNNKQVFLLTSGLGLQLTGAAVAHALRMTTSFWFLANCFLVATYLLNFYIWYVALRKFPAPAPAAAVESAPAREIEVR